MFLTILSISDCLGMCFQIIDNGVSIGTSAWDICVYLISGGQVVLTGWGFSGNNEYFLSLIWIYGPVC